MTPVIQLPRISRIFGWLPLFSLIVLVLANLSFGQEFKNSIVSTDFDFILEDDPSTFSELSFVDKRISEMPAKDSDELLKEAYVFEARFTDNTKVVIFINSTVGSEETARKEAERFVHPLGKLPSALRQGVRRLCVHPGGERLTAFSDVGLIVMYSDNASVRIQNHDLEETLFHESVHAAWDQEHARSNGWSRAQASDGNFATLYAKSKPDREDLAETTLFAYTILHHPERLPETVKTSLMKNIPARIRYVAELLPPGQPIHFDVVQSANDPQITDPPQTREGQSSLTDGLDDNEPLSPCDVRFSGIAADVVSNCLLLDFQLEERAVRNLLDDADDRYQSGEEVFQVACKTFELDAEKLRASVLKHLHVNCKHEDDFDDSAIRKVVEGWKKVTKN